MSDFAQRFNQALEGTALFKAMSRSEAASIAGKASAAARRAASGGSGSAYDQAVARANKLVAAGVGQGKGKGKGKGRSAKGSKAKAADPAKAAKEAQAAKEHAQRLQEHEADRAQRLADHQKAQAEHDLKFKQQQEDRANRLKAQADKAKAAAAKAKSKAPASKSKSGGGGKSKTMSVAAHQALIDSTNAKAAARNAKLMATPASKQKMTPPKTPAKAPQTAPKAPKPTGTPNNVVATPAVPVNVAQKLEKSDNSTLIYQGWAEITKIDEEKRLVFGIASTEDPDSQAGIWKGDAYNGDIISSQAMRDAAPGYLEYPAIREMHQPIAAGTAIHFEVDGSQTLIGAHIVDDQAWAKVISKTYRGFSIGGKALEAELIKIEGIPFRRITKLKLTEISLVDRPANPQARITLFKGVDMPADQTEEQVEETENTDDIAKAADPSKAIAMLQQLRNDAETSGDMDAADGYTAAIRSVAQAAGLADDGDDDSDADAAGVGSEDVSADDGSAPSSDDMTMNDKPGDVQKRGAMLSSANLAHAKTAHDALQKMTGGAVCAPQGANAPGQNVSMVDRLAPEDLAKAFAPAFDGITGLLEKFGVDLGGLAKRLEVVEKQPVGNVPATRLVPAEKNIPGSEPAQTPVVDEIQKRIDVLKKQRDETDDPNILRYLGDEITKLSISRGYKLGG